MKDSLNIIEVFASVQGETSFSGLPTSFIRLAQCNLRCSWCDTTYSFGRGTPYSLKQIVDQVNDYGCRYVCVTGGEPLLQSAVYPLISQLCDLGYSVSVETGGSLKTTAIDQRAAVILDVKCPGSGMNHKNEWSNLSCLRPMDEVKFVLLDENDYVYAKEICQKYALYEKVKEVLFSPVHEKLEAKKLVQWILKDRLPVRLNLQIHKVIWPADTRGV